MLTPLMTNLKALPNYKLEILFETGEKKIFDVKPYIKGDWYGKLADETYFRSVRLHPNGIDIQWPDEQDIAPHNLYEDSLPC